MGGDREGNNRIAIKDFNGDGDIIVTNNYGDSIGYSFFNRTGTDAGGDVLFEYNTVLNAGTINSDGETTELDLFDKRSVNTWRDFPSPISSAKRPLKPYCLREFNQ